VDGSTLIYLIDKASFYVTGFVCAVVAVWALIDCLIRKSPAFEANFKRSKGFWLGITAAAAFVTLLGLLLPQGSGFIFGFGGYGLFNIAAVTAAGVYLADVRPAVMSR
jgi:magnesium-transporting ATPase (P-type)